MQDHAVERIRRAVPISDTASLPAQTQANRMLQTALESLLSLWSKAPVSLPKQRCVPVGKVIHDGGVFCNDPILPVLGYRLRAVTDLIGLDILVDSPSYPYDTLYHTLHEGARDMEKTYCPKILMHGDLMLELSTIAVTLRPDADHLHPSVIMRRTAQLRKVVDGMLKYPLRWTLFITVKGFLLEGSERRFLARWTH